MQNGAKGQQVGLGSEHHGAIDAGNVLQHGRREVEDALVAQQIMQLVLAGNSLRHRLVIHVVEQIGLRHQRPRRLRIVEHHEQRASAALGEVQGHGKQALRQLGVADGVLPHFVAIARIHQPPFAVEKAEDGHAIGENFDLAVGRQDEADMSAAQSGAAVVAVACRGRHRQRHVAIGLGPFVHVDQFRQQAVAANQGESLQAIAQTMETADGGQLVGIAQGPVRRLRRLMTRLRHGAKQQHSGGNATVLVGAHAANGFAAGVRRRIEEGRDKPVLRQSAEELKTLRRQRLVGDQLIARGKHHADAAQQPPFLVRQIRTYGQRVARPQPLEFDLASARHRAQHARHPLRAAR